MSPTTDYDCSMTLLTANMNTDCPFHNNHNASSSTMQWVREHEQNKEKWKDYCVWSIKGCERVLDVPTHWLATPIICSVLLLHNISIFQHRSLFSEYPEAEGWNPLQPPVTRYKSTRCHTSEYLKNQCSCEKFKCKNTRSWPCCTWYLSVTWRSFRPCPKTSPFSTKQWLQSLYRAKLRKLKDVYSHHTEHVMACSSTALVDRECFDIHSCLQVRGQVWISECSIPNPLHT
jgi:hypothetical protein